MARVRIKEHDRHPEFSIALAIGAAVLIWFTILLWSTSASVPAAQRDLAEIPVIYECDDGHQFEDHADTKSLPCADSGCNLRAWPIWSYQCTKHGAFLYQLRYHRTESQRPRIKAARSVGGTWEEVADEISCPFCERVLLPDLTLRPLLSRGPRASPSQIEVLKSPALTTQQSVRE